jgi:hypothetical protein
VTRAWGNAKSKTINREEDAGFWNPATNPTKQFWIAP